MTSPTDPMRDPGLKERIAEIRDDLFRRQRAEQEKASLGNGGELEPITAERAFAIAANHMRDLLGALQDASPQPSVSDLREWLKRKADEARKGEREADDSDGAATESGAAQAFEEAFLFIAKAQPEPLQGDGRDLRRRTIERASVQVAADKTGFLRRADQEGDEQ